MAPLIGVIGPRFPDDPGGIMDNPPPRQKTLLSGHNRGEESPISVAISAPPLEWVKKGGD